MGMLLRSHFVQPLCFKVEESEACMRVNFPHVSEVGRGRAGARNLLS